MSILHPTSLTQSSTRKHVCKAQVHEMLAMLAEVVLVLEVWSMYTLTPTRLIRRHPLLQPSSCGSMCTRISLMSIHIPFNVFVPHARCKLVNDATCDCTVHAVSAWQQGMRAARLCPMLTAHKRVQLISAHCPVSMHAVHDSLIGLQPKAVSASRALGRKRPCVALGFKTTCRCSTLT